MTSTLARLAAHLRIKPMTLERIERAHQRNSSKRRRGSSPFKGVTWDRERGKWRAQIAVPGSKLHLGDFASEREAANAYDRAACELFGDFARPNFPKAGVA